MPKEEIANTGAEQVAEEVKIDAVVTPTIEESVDARIEKAISPMKNIKPDPLEEADKASEESGDDEESDEDAELVVTPAKEATPAPQEIVTPPPVENIESRSVPSIDKRIAKLYQETLILQGSTAPETADVLSAIAGASFQDKQQALHRLLAERRGLRGETGVAEMDAEDREAIIEAQVEERLQSMQSEITERERADDLITTLDSHPELDERSKEYNPNLASAVEKLYNNGMKVSDAYDFVLGEIAKAQQGEVKKQKQNDAIKKQQALAGAVSTGSAFGEGETKMTETEIKHLRVHNSREYNRLVKAGKI